MSNDETIFEETDRPGEQNQEILVTVADVVGNKWHPVIIQRLLSHEPLRFSDLSHRIGSITNKMLSQSLDNLQQQGLVRRTVVSKKPVAVEYSLTERGRSMEPVIEAMQEWGETHLKSAYGQKNDEPEGPTRA